MVRKLIKCRGCGNEFWTKQIKVYVFKERVCSKCKTVMNIKDGLYICTKCGFTVNPKTPDGVIAFGMLGVNIRGTSRDIIEAEQKRQIGTMEVEKVFVDEADLCQKCQNFLTQRMQAMKNNDRKKKEGGETWRQLTKEEETDAIKKEINRKINADYAAKQRAEEEAKKTKALADEMMKQAKDEVAKKVMDATKGTQ